MIEYVACHSERSEESQLHIESSCIAKAGCFAPLSYGVLTDSMTA